MEFLSTERAAAKESEVEAEIAGITSMWLRRTWRAVSTRLSRGGPYEMHRGSGTAYGPLTLGQTRTVGNPGT